MFLKLRDIGRSGYRCSGGSDRAGGFPKREHCTLQSFNLGFRGLLGFLGLWVSRRVYYGIFEAATRGRPPPKASKP